MEINLILTAQTWKLSDALECGQSHGGVLVVKNVPARTYLAVTPKQWQLLRKFVQPRTVPKVLEQIIEERTCPALGEFYELVLKAVRAGVLREATELPPAPGEPAVNWPLALSPSHWSGVLTAGLVAGVALAAWFRPPLPVSVRDGLAGLAWLLGAVAAGAALAASLLRGAGGEVYRHGRWRISSVDAGRFSPADQRAILFGSVTPLALVTGLLAWQRPEWSWVPLAGLLFRLRPMLGGPVGRVVRVGAEVRLADAEHDFLFPANRSARLRWKLLRRLLRMRTTWLEVGYAVGWTLALGWFTGEVHGGWAGLRAFGQANGLRLGLAFVGSLVLLALGYAGLEAWVFLRERARARHETLRQAWRRWFGRAKVVTDDSARQRAIMASPLLRQLSPPAQQALSRALQPVALGAWKTLHDFDAPVDRVSLILSGKVGVYRRNASGRRVRVQVLAENDLVGLHAAGDPERPLFLYRTLTPVVLARADWAVAEELVVRRFKPAILANLVQKLPFLTRISLCQYWHVQSIQRFAEITRVANYADSEIILQQGFYSDSFYIVFEGEARIMIKGRQVGVLGAENFFGEIGLLQNSSATAQVVAGPGTRCLCIPRQEFLRFVAHNHAVALKLEQVSSRRLGRPIFPLTPGNFRTI